MSARTVTVGRRLRCQTMPSSKPSSSVAIWLSGTALPLAVGIASDASMPSRSRSSPGPRSRISTASLPSRYVLTEVPDSEPDRNFATAAELTPSARARSWSMRRRTTLLGSLQSRFTFVTCGLARTLSATWRAIACTRSMCSPDTRNCTG